MFGGNRLLGIAGVVIALLAAACAGDPTGSTEYRGLASDLGEANTQIADLELEIAEGERKRIEPPRKLRRRLLLQRRPTKRPRWQLPRPNEQVRGSRQLATRSNSDEITRALPPRSPGPLNSAKPMKQCAGSTAAQSSSAPA